MKRRQPGVPGLLLLLGSLALVWPLFAKAAQLPVHRPLRILIVSDEVNPHGLSDAELTQPSDLSAALLDPAAGLNLDINADAVLEISTNSIELATTELERSPHDPLAYDVLIYFAHRIPNNGPDNLGRQQAFETAVDGFLSAGGGLIAFHHGSYTAGGKQGILSIIGATAGAVSWDTVNGQDIIATAPDHFVSCYEVGYPQSRAYADPARGVPADNYPVFTNTPDERYPVFDYNADAGEVTTLFASDYANSGTTHLLGFEHRRPEWAGTVIGYQPGEYQPLALDDKDGNNFQILVNAIVYAAPALPEDAIVLTMTPGGDPGAVDLAWDACESVFDVYRSDDPATIADPANRLTQTQDRTFSDTPPSGALHFYRILRP